MGVFADGFDVQNIVGGVYNGAGELESENFEVVRVDDGFGDLSNGAAGLDTENWSADEA